MAENLFLGAIIAPERANKLMNENSSSVNPLAAINYMLPEPNTYKVDRRKRFYLSGQNPGNCENIN